MHKLIVSLIMYNYDWVIYIACCDLPITEKCIYCIWIMVEACHYMSHRHTHTHTHTVFACSFYLSFPFLSHSYPFVTFASQCLYICLMLTVHWLARISFFTMRMWKGDMGSQKIKGYRSKVALGMQSASFRSRRGSLQGFLFYQLMHMPKSSMSVQRVGSYMQGSERIQAAYKLRYSGSKRQTLNILCSELYKS